jgi:beta-glucosidase
MESGCDQEGGGADVIGQLMSAVEKKDTTAAKISTSFRRLFRIRMRLGMLDPPTLNPFNTIEYNSTELRNNAAHRAVARTASLEAMTLLRNNPLPTDPPSNRATGSSGGATGKAKLTLPLSPGDFTDKGSLLLVGPQASANYTGLLFGNYGGGHAKNNWTVSITDAIAARVAKAGFESAPTAEAGAVVQVDGCLSIGCSKEQDHQHFAPAVAAAKHAKAVVVFLGLAFDDYCGQKHGDENSPGDSCEQEGFDRDIIELPKGQEALVQALQAAVGATVPLIGVLVHGASIALPACILAHNNDQQNSKGLDAVLDAWQPGGEGGHAIASTLFGDVSPAGRSPVTWYRSSAELPVSCKQNGVECRAQWYPQPADPKADPPTNATKGLTYRYYDGEPLVPFGYGLSYSTFAYSNLELQPLGTSSGVAAGAVSASYSACDKISVQVQVTNTGSMDSDEVVQLYVDTPDATVPKPRVRLADFQRVHIPAGKSVTVKLTALPATRAVYNDPSGGDPSGFDVYTGSKNQVIQRGALTFFVGGGQPAFFKGGLTANATIGTNATLLSCEQ